MSAARRVPWLALSLLAAGCAYTVEVSSPAHRAELVAPDGQVHALPAEVKLRWAPFRRQQVVGRAEGYRVLSLPLQGHPGLQRRPVVRWTDFLLDPIFHPREALGMRPRCAVVLVLVPEHGPVETWDATTVEQGADARP